MSIWHKQYTLKEINELSKNTLNENVGIEFTEIGEDFVVGKMPVDSRTVQPFRILHGGASAALAETLGSVASMMCLDIEKNLPVGLELNINHLRSAKTGYVFGFCKPIHIGKSTHVWGIEIKDAPSTASEGKLIATSRITIMILDRKL